MKTLQTLAAALLITFSMSAFAAAEPNSKRFNMNYAVQTYIDAMVNGNTKELADFLDSEVEFSSTRANTVITHKKSEILKSLKDLQNVKQNCKTSYSVLEHNPAQAIVKVSMKYDGFTKVNYVTMKSSSDGWKITSVNSSFK